MVRRGRLRDPRPQLAGPRRRARPRRARWRDDRVLRGEDPPWRRVRLAGRGGDRRASSNACGCSPVAGSPPTTPPRRGSVSTSPRSAPTGAAAGPSTCSPTRSRRRRWGREGREADSMKAETESSRQGRVRRERSRRRCSPCQQPRVPVPPVFGRVATGSRPRALRRGGSRGRSPGTGTSSRPGTAARGEPRSGRRLRRRRRRSSRGRQSPRKRRPQHEERDDHQRDHHEHDVAPAVHLRAERVEAHATKLTIRVAGSRRRRGGADSRRRRRSAWTRCSSSAPAVW